MREMTNSDPMEIAQGEAKALSSRQAMIESAEQGAKIAARVQGTKESVVQLRKLQANGCATEEDVRQLAHMEKWLRDCASVPLATEKERFEMAYNGFVSLVGFNRESIRSLDLIRKDAETLVGNSEERSV
jgi:hypothetical protein